jgi:hypothetical protein
VTQATARGFGGVFLLIGVLGLVTTPFSMSSELLLGLFPVNVLHNLVHLAFGGWGWLPAVLPTGRPRTAASAGSHTSRWPWWEP